jgi:SOS response regulatory protein OraA/RecX
MNETKHAVTAVVSTNAGVSVTVRSPGDETEKIYLLKRKTVRELGIEEGSAIDEDLVGVLEDEAQLGRAEARMVRILSYSDHSVSMLVRKLIAYGFSREIAERAAQSAVDAGYIKEREQAKTSAEYFLRHKYWGKKRIAMELMSRGYMREAVSEAIESIGDDSFCNMLVKLIEKKFPECPTDRTEVEKMKSSLCRMGYSISEINYAMKEVYGA